MKKILFIATTLATINFSHAQQLVSKSGTPILPETGDWSIGFDVVPVIKAAGNLFHTADNGSLSQADQTLVALYVKNPRTAYRVRARIGYHSNVWENKVTDVTYTGTGVAPQVTDSWTENKFNITLGFGIQKNRGKGRLRGIYGGEFFFMYGTDKNTYTYGNKFSQAQSTPTFTIFDPSKIPGPFETRNDTTSRISSNDRGSTVGFGVNGFLGAEYFFAPKFSLSAEYLWGFAYSSTGEGQAAWEGINLSGTVQTTTVQTGKNSMFALDVQNAASIVLHIYF